MNNNNLISAVAIFIIISLTLHCIKPDFMYDEDGKMKTFGCGTNQTLMHFFLVSLVLSTLIYFLVYYVNKGTSTKHHNSYGYSYYQHPQMMNYGGGMGLICSCDFILASSDSQFGFPEVRLGMIPAIISPYVNRKLDLSRMRELFITGEKFGLEKALGLGLLYESYEGDFSSPLQTLTSFITKQFLLRSVTSNQSTTVFPIVIFDSSSTITLHNLPEKSSGLIKYPITQGSCRGDDNVLYFFL